MRNWAVSGGGQGSTALEIAPRSRVDRCGAGVVSDRRIAEVVQQHWKGVGSYATVGLEFTLSVVVGLFVGRWLDGRFDTRPWLTLIGFTYGLAAGGRAIYRALKRANREAEELERKDQDERKKFNDDQEPKP